MIQTDIDQISKNYGVFTTETGKGRVEVYVDNNELLGKLIWTRDHDVPKKDVFVLKGFKMKGNHWVDGTLFNPETNKSYTSKIEIFENRMAILIKYGLYTHKVIWHKVK